MIIYEKLCDLNTFRYRSSGHIFSINEKAYILQPLDFWLKVSKLDNSLNTSNMKGIIL